MREHGRWQRHGSTIVIELPSVTEIEPPSTTEVEEETGSPSTWPPKKLRGRMVVRHWHGSGDVLTERLVDPGFTAPSAALQACLDGWRKSTTPSAAHAHVSLVDLSGGAPVYVGLRDRAEVHFASTSKLGVMYPVFQLLNDLMVVAAAVRPSSSRDLYAATRQQWAKDLVSAGRFKSESAARRWVVANGPDLEHCARLDRGAVVFDPGLRAAVTAMIVDSSEVGRTRCIELLRAFYMDSVLAQSGEILRDPLILRRRFRGIRRVG